MSQAVTAAVAKPPPRTWAQQLVDRVKADVVQPTPSTATPTSYLRAAGAAAARYTVGGAVGGLLGASHARFIATGGNDTRFGPVEMYVALAGAIAGVGLHSSSPVAAWAALEAGADAVTVLSFRRAFELVAGESFGVGRLPAAPPKTTPKVDRIEQVAREVNL
jgi:hypothetical protein